MTRSDIKNDKQETKMKQSGLRQTTFKIFTPGRIIT